jgi:hypothetical protein
LLNSQFPYNQLPKLHDITLEISPALENACKTCWKSLYHLHGYIDALSPESLKDDLLLLQISDAKYSFDLDHEPVSFTRLFEGFSSENTLNDKTLTMIFHYISYLQSTHKIDLNTLKPAYSHSYKRNQDLFRDKAEVNVKSYHTNLTLYTAPNQAFVMNPLKHEIDLLFGKPAREDELIDMSLCHFQLRAISPYTHLNHHVARVYTQLWVKSLRLNFNFLPISRIISQDRETYQVMMRTVVNDNKYADWCHYFIEIVNEGSRYLLDRLKMIQGLKKHTLEMMDKYTVYKLPATELLPVVFSRPFIKPKYLVDKLHCHRQTAYIYLEHLVKAGILIEKKSGREKLYLHKRLFDVLSN